MNVPFEKERASTKLFLASFIMYLMVCMVKSNYTASIAYIVNEGIFTKTDSGLISASFYLVYGLGQLLGGGLSDRFSPYKVITIGILGSLLSNLALCFTMDFIWVLIIWSLCGLAQFGIWPSICKIIAGLLISEHRQKAGVYMVLCIGIGGVLSYLLTVPIMELGGWIGIFGFNVSVLLAVLVLWLITEKKTQPVLYHAPVPSQKKEKVKNEHAFMPLLFRSGLIFLAIVSVFSDMLNIGLKSWVSTMMVESYGITPTWANMQTMVIYLANLIGTFLLVMLFNRMKNEVKIKGIFMALCLPMYAVVLMIGKAPQWTIILSIVIATTILYSIGNINVRISSAFERYGYSATASGLLNAMASFGIVLANGGFGLIADHFGWGSVTTILFVTCFAAVLLCIPATFLWRKFTAEKSL